MVTQTVNTDDSADFQQDLLLNLYVSLSLKEEKFLENGKYEFRQESIKQYVKTGHTLLPYFPPLVRHHKL